MLIDMNILPARKRTIYSITCPSKLAILEGRENHVFPEYHAFSSKMQISKVVDLFILHLFGLRHFSVKLRLVRDIGQLGSHTGPVWSKFYHKIAISGRRVQYQEKSLTAKL